MAAGIFLLIFLFLGPALVSCAPLEDMGATVRERFFSEKELDNALKATEDFLEAVINNDYQAAYSLISESDREMGSYEDFKMEFKDVTQIVSFKMNWVEVKSSMAVVNIDFVDYYDGTQKTYTDIDIALVKEDDGSWKINFWPKN